MGPKQNRSLLFLLHFHGIDESVAPNAALCEREAVDQT